MPLKLWISCEEEAEIPNFKSHEEARKYFKEKYGDAFQISESCEVDGEQVYFYMYIVDRYLFFLLLQPFWPHILYTLLYNASSCEHVLINDSYSLTYYHFSVSTY